MEPRGLLNAFARAIGLYFVVSGLVTIVAIAVGDSQVWEQLAAPVVSFLAGLFLLARGDVVASWAFRSRDSGSEGSH